jgi:hypothetical protein
MWAAALMGSLVAAAAPRAPATARAAARAAAAPLSAAAVALGLAPGPPARAAPRLPPPRARGLSPAARPGLSRRLRSSSLFLSPASPLGRRRRRAAPLTLATLPPPPKKNTEKLGARYRRAMALEAAFFAAQPGLAPPRRRVSLLVVDFDDTCTLADSCATIARCAIARVAARAGTAGGGAAAEAAERARLEARLSELVAAYAARRDALLREVLPPALDVSLNLPCAATFLPARFNYIHITALNHPPTRSPLTRPPSLTFPGSASSSTASPTLTATPTRCS